MLLIYSVFLCLPYYVGLGLAVAGSLYSIHTAWTKIPTTLSRLKRLEKVAFSLGLSSLTSESRAHS